jgi:hypothetical protein
MEVIGNDARIAATGVYRLPSSDIPAMRRAEITILIKKLIQL